MKYIKALLITILLVCTFTITKVYAEDITINSTDTKYDKNTNKFTITGTSNFDEVMVSIFDSNNNLKVLKTVSTNNNSYTATINIVFTQDQTVTVKVGDIEKTDHKLLNVDVEKSEVPIESGDEVIVIGAGNVAMDACRTAVRMKAKKVTVAYRKTAEFMRAAKAEYDGAISDGVEFKWEHAPVEFVGENGVVTGLKCQTPEGEVILPANKILIAIGSRPAARIVNSTEGINVDEGGYVVTKQKPYGMTTKRGVFAGGDVVHKPATVVLAMREAKKVAVGISEFLEAKKLLGE